jgi:hypothetical protein
MQLIGIQSSRLEFRDFFAYKLCLSGSPMTAALYNLVIFHNPRHQDVSDFLSIRDMMARRAPEIEVSIVTPDTPASFWPRAAARPSVLFSPYAARIAKEVRGARLVSIALSKLNELELLRRAGCPVPETRLITPDLRLDEDEWGPLTVVKPNAGYLGRGVRLMRTRDVRWVDTALLPEDDPRHDRKLLAQRYIDTGPYVRCHRVMSVLGRPIYSIVSTALEKRPELVNGEIEIAANDMARTITMSNEPDVIELAAAIHAKYPRLPLMALDIIRESKTGRLFALEYNSVGYSWHLSSEHGRKHQRDFGLDLYGQFNALDTITDALIEATRKYAV